MDTAIKYGQKIKLRHVATGFLLHSHNIMYTHAGTSGQQMITAFGGFDDNDFWLVKRQHGQPIGDMNAPVNDGDVIRLEHFLTRRNLHSHSGFPSPLTKQQEVTGFGFVDGDGNDNWKVEVTGGGVWDSSKQIRLIHVPTNHALHSHGGFSDSVLTVSQQEVTGFPKRDGNDFWTVLITGSDVPIKRTESDNVGNGKSMDTTATLFTNGLLLIETQSRSGHLTEALRGQLFVICQDEQGRAIWVSKVHHCTTRCAKLDFSCASSGKDSFTEDFPPAVGQFTKSLDIVHSESGLGEHRKVIVNLIKTAKEIAPEIKAIVAMLSL